MAVFVIRVELHGASREQYRMLASDMAGMGAFDKIKSADGRWWRLPSGEFRYEGLMSLEQMRDAVEHAALSICRSCAILVTAAAGMAFTGLQDIPSAPGAAGGFPVSRFDETPGE